MTDPHTRDVEELLRLKTEECERLREALRMIRQHYSSDPNALAGMFARAALQGEG